VSSKPGAGQIASAFTPTIYYSSFSGAAFIPFPIEFFNEKMGGPDLFDGLKDWFRFH